MKVVMGDSSRIGRPPTHRLADGQPALEVARQNGIPANTARSRLQRGWTIEEATGLAPPPRRGGRPAGVVLSDGRTALVVARENGVTQSRFYWRIRCGWSPEQAAGLLPPPGDSRGS